jgi:hypothetical protein
LTSVANVRRELRSPVKGPHYVTSFKEDWDARTRARLLEMGFVGAGAWGELTNMPYYRVLSIHASITVPVSDPTWESRVDELLKKEISHLRGDKNLVGYFFDNELDWCGLKTDADKYFDVCHRMVKKHDPNHLILGVRFHRPPPAEVLDASVGRTDAHSVNNYQNDGKAWKALFKYIYTRTECPSIISEFSFYCDDNRSHNKNTRNGGGRVKCQQERGKMLEFFVEGMADTSFIIGTEWFQYMDQPPHGRFDGEDYNYGLFDILDMPYEHVTSAARRVNARVNDIHAKSGDTQASAVWKDWEEGVLYLAP